ncbi:hypothetical protein BJ878DRAFT_49190 [Calycina marina]|uniref:Uncharacterized protein n=1 Tax=Calycina marina TaxID=1763456 RepID=A0A9P7Z3C1_9HELO|nr:hypothetical protein BJ878DRAFT_49190 [Calycina marina]
MLQLEVADEDAKNWDFAFASAELPSRFQVMRTVSSVIGALLFGTNPYCGHVCSRSFSLLPLTCSHTISVGGHIIDAKALHTIAHCRAGNSTFLSSITGACTVTAQTTLTSRCVRRFGRHSLRETWPSCRYEAYEEVMAKITEPPTRSVDIEDRSGVLNGTVLTTQETFDVTWTTLYYFFPETVLKYTSRTCAAFSFLPCLWYLINLLWNAQW